MTKAKVQPIMPAACGASVRTDSSVPPPNALFCEETHVEKVVAMFEAIKEFGVYCRARRREF